MQNFVFFLFLSHFIDPFNWSSDLTNEWINKIEIGSRRRVKETNFDEQEKNLIQSKELKLNKTKSKHQQEKKDTFGPEEEIQYGIRLIIIGSN